jgi:hypothetical protein
MMQDGLPDTPVVNLPVGLRTENKVWEVWGMLRFVVGVVLCLRWRVHKLGIPSAKPSTT